MGSTVLVTGASGFVGSHLATALVEAGHQVRAMTRHPDRYDGAGEPVPGDVADRASLDAALTGVDVAMRALQTATRRLRLDQLGERQSSRVTLLQGSLTYTDRRLKG